MDINSKYRPCNLTYYTTWWLASKSSISSQTTPSGSAKNSLKSNDECLIIQQAINQNKIQSNCCIPFKRIRRKR